MMNVLLERYRDHLRGPCEGLASLSYAELTLVLGAIPGGPQREGEPLITLI
jgi:hypothetical protein